MILQGDEEGFSPPYDAPLYGRSEAPDTPASTVTSDYLDCSALASFFTLARPIRDLLPRGVQPASDPAMGGFIVADYPFSTLGSYRELIAMVQVLDPDGEVANYIPYIYVTNDAAMAAGREIAGAPKKIADIELRRDGTGVQGIVERPEGVRLLTMTGNPEERAGEDSMVSDLMNEGSSLLSVRALPPIEGGDGLAQLVRWSSEMNFKESDGEPEVWVGPTSVSFDTRAVRDPLYKLEVEEYLFGMYSRFNMQLGMEEVVTTWEL